MGATDGTETATSQIDTLPHRQWCVVRWPPHPLDDHLPSASATYETGLVGSRAPVRCTDKDVQ